MPQQGAVRFDEFTYFQVHFHIETQVRSGPALIAWRREHHARALCRCTAMHASLWLLYSRGSVQSISLILSLRASLDFLPFWECPQIIAEYDVAHQC